MLYSIVAVAFVLYSNGLILTSVPSAGSPVGIGRQRLGVRRLSSVMDIIFFPSNNRG